MKEGILLEAGFNTVTPNQSISISSWAYDKAIETESITIANNRAIDVQCYHPGYTFVEKLQTIATNFRHEQEDRTQKPNYMRQYYDVYCLLDYPQVLDFIGTAEYAEHKEKGFQRRILKSLQLKMKRFYFPIQNNVRHSKNDMNLQEICIFKGQPDFDEVLERIKKFIGKL